TSELTVSHGKRHGGSRTMTYAERPDSVNRPEAGDLQQLQAAQQLAASLYTPSSQEVFSRINRPDSQSRPGTNPAAQSMLDGFALGFDYQTALASGDTRADHIRANDRQRVAPDGSIIMTDRHSDRQIRMTPEGTYIVTGTDGEPREFVPARDN